MWHKSPLRTTNWQMPSVNTFNDIIHNMPQSEHAFRLAKDGLIARLRTSFVIKSSVLWDYVDAQDMGIDTDRRIKVYNDVQDMTLQEVVNFQKKWIKAARIITASSAIRKNWTWMP